MIYLDNAATSFVKPPQVAQAVYDSFSRIGNAGRGAHEPTLNASRMIFDTRKKLARLFNIPDLSRIAFTCNDTEALNIAVSGLVKAPGYGFPAGCAVTSVCEHNSVLRPLFVKEDAGAHLSILSADEYGRISPGDLDSAMEKNDIYLRSVSGGSMIPQVVVLAQASNLTGNTIDLRLFSGIVHRHGGIFVADAAQSAGEIPIDVQDMGVDVLCFTGHKALLGPQGTGGIYVREGLELPAFKSGGSGVASYDRHQPPQMPTVLEAGTLNGHGLAGLNAAVSFLLETGVENIYRKDHRLAQMFADKLRNIPGIKLYGDLVAQLRAPIVTLNIAGLGSGEVSDLLWEEHGICTRSGAHCAPLMHKSLGTAEQGAVRFSFSYFNTEEEVSAAAEAVRKIAEDAAGGSSGGHLS